MQVSRNNLLFILLFVGGIILPTAILAVLSFRNIQNEIFLAQKNFNENRTAFQNDVEESVLKEQHKVFLETKNASLFLYEQPQRLLDFGHASEFKSVDGIEAIFLFNQGALIYPDISSRHFFKSTNFSNKVATLKEKKLFSEEFSGLQKKTAERTTSRSVQNRLGPASICSTPPNRPRIYWV